LGAALINLDGTAYKIYESEMLVYKKESILTPYYFQKKPNRYLERAEFRDLFRAFLEPHGLNAIQAQSKSVFLGGRP
jgi:hypothetical protein